MHTWLCRLFVYFVMQAVAWVVTPVLPLFREDHLGNSDGLFYPYQKGIHQHGNGTKRFILKHST